MGNSATKQRDDNGVDDSSRSTAGSQQQSSLISSQSNSRDSIGRKDVAQNRVMSLKISVDEGVLSPLKDCVYPTAVNDWDQTSLQNLILERRLAPFYKGLDDLDEPLPPISDRESSLEPHPLLLKYLSIAVQHKLISVPSTESLDNVDLNSISQSLPSSPDANSHINTFSRETKSATNINKRRSSSAVYISDQIHNSINGKSNSLASQTLPHQSPSFKQRSRRVFSFGSNEKTTLNYIPGTDHKLITNKIPTIPQSLLYKYMIECPICFLNYPSNINYTRCCDYAICTECFLQIKRTEPNFDPSVCPFCVEPHFGILYHQIGSKEWAEKVKEAYPEEFLEEIYQELTYRNDNQLPSDSSTNNSTTGEVQKSDASINSSPNRDRKRRFVSYKNAEVVSADDIRPDWQKRQHQLLIQRITNSNRTAPVTSSRNALGSNNNRARLNTEDDYAAAASAAAEMAESLQHMEPGSRRRIPISNAQGAMYLQAVRNMGADIEELMMIEAIRQSLLESQNGQETEREREDAERRRQEEGAETNIESSENPALNVPLVQQDSEINDSNDNSGHINNEENSVGVDCDEDIALNVIAESSTTGNGGESSTNKVENPVDDNQINTEENCIKSKEKEDNEDASDSQEAVDGIDATSSPTNTTATVDSISEDNQRIIEEDDSDLNDKLRTDRQRQESNLTAAESR